MVSRLEWDMMMNVNSKGMMWEVRGGCPARPMPSNSPSDIGSATGG